MNHRTILLAAATLAAAAIAGQASAQQNPAVAKSLSISAIAFDRFNTEAGRLDGKFADGRAVASGVAIGAGYDSKQFEKGMIAYAAFAAMREQAFAAGVRRAAEASGSTDEFVRQLIADPRLAARIDGADVAAARLRTALALEAAPVRTAGAAVKQAAYDVQHQTWSKSFVPDRSGRLARAKTLSKPAADLDEARLQQVIDRSAAAQPTGPIARTSTVDRALTLAALAVLGRAGDADEGQIAPLLSGEESAWCFNMAKLNYFQCLSVAGPHYEDIYCLGKHAIGDTAQCMVEAASLDDAMLAPARRPDPVLIKVAETIGR